MFRRAGSIISLGLVLLLGVLPKAFAGGKAEAYRIQFQPGSPVATITGKLTGDVQFESVVAATQGEWMMVEALSDPADAAVFTLKDPNGQETRNQYRWSGTLTQTGDYLIWVSKPADYKHSNFTLIVTLGSKPAVMRDSATNKDSAALYSAMRKFIDAARSRRRNPFLTSFSRTKPFYQLNPQNIGARKHYRVAVSFMELAAGLRWKKGLYWMYMERGDNGDRDAFVDNMPDGRMWQRVAGNKFVPPGAEITSSTYVKWRKEGKRWVIDEISYPHA